MKNSARFSLNGLDWHKWLWDSFIFLVPALLVIVSQVQALVPTLHVPVWVIPVLSYVLAQLTALLKKYVQGPVK